MKRMKMRKEGQHSRQRKEELSISSLYEMAQVPKRDKKKKRM